MNEEEEEEEEEEGWGRVMRATSTKSTDFDYKLALKLQFDELPPEFTKEPFLMHEVVHSLLPNASLYYPDRPQLEPQLTEGDGGAPRPAPEDSVQFTDVQRTEAVHMDQASCSSAVVTNLPLGQKIRADHQALRNGFAAALESKMLRIQAVGESKLLQDQMNGGSKSSSAVRVTELACELMDLINTQLELLELVQQVILLVFSELGNSHTIDSTTAWDMVTKAIAPGLLAGVQDNSTANNATDEVPVAVMSVEPPERCSICLEDREQGEMMSVAGCWHRFCVGCIARYAGAELREGRAPRCPEAGCRREMTMEQCGGVLSKEQYEAASRRRAEAAIPEVERLYCPYADCSELFQMEFEPEEMRERETTCWSCGRSFCIFCRVASHRPLSCSQYQELPLDERHHDDIKLYELAALHSWQRCGQCRRFIQRSEGCVHMRCRCGYEFCYRCGTKWRSCNCR